MSEAEFLSLYGKLAGGGKLDIVDRFLLGQELKRRMQTNPLSPGRADDPKIAAVLTSLAELLR